MKEEHNVEERNMIFKRKREEAEFEERSEYWKTLNYKDFLKK
jgi:hypothetical protein